MSAAGSIAGMVIGRMLAQKLIPSIKGLGALEPGRYPHPVYGPIIIPRGAEAERKPGSINPPFRIATWGFAAAWVALVWYACRKKSGLELSGDEDLWKASQLPGLRRELRFEPEDPADSEDPVEACLERNGWQLDRIRELRSSIADKSQPSLFSEEEEEYTPSEEELLDDIEECLDKIERQYGSLEAAGLESVPCIECEEAVKL